MASGAGHTLQAADTIVQSVRELPLDPALPLGADVLNVVRDGFAPVIVDAKLASGAPAFQLERLAGTGEIIRATVERRLRGSRHELTEDWDGLIAAQIGSPSSKG